MCWPPLFLTLFPLSGMEIWWQDLGQPSWTTRWKLPVEDTKNPREKESWSDDSTLLDEVGNGHITLSLEKENKLLFWFRHYYFGALLQKPIRQPNTDTQLKNMWRNERLILFNSSSAPQLFPGLEYLPCQRCYKIYCLWSSFSYPSSSQVLKVDSKRKAVNERAWLMYKMNNWLFFWAVAVI